MKTPKSLENIKTLRDKFYEQRESLDENNFFFDENNSHPSYTTEIKWSEPPNIYFRFQIQQTQDTLSYKIKKVEKGYKIIYIEFIPYRMNKTYNVTKDLDVNLWWKQYFEEECISMLKDIKRSI